MPTTDAGRATLEALNLVTDNDWPAYCARLRLVIDCRAADAAPGTTLVRDGEPTPSDVYAAEQLRDWYRETLIPWALDCAESRAESLQRQRAREMIDTGNVSRSARGLAFRDSLAGATVQMLRALASDALDGIPWAAWLEDTESVLEGHEWAPVALRLWDTLKSTNPDEPSGEWSPFDLAERVNVAERARVAGRAQAGEPFDGWQEIGADAARDALEALAYHELVSSRYVGGTSRHLYALLPATRLP